MSNGRKRNGVERAQRARWVTPCVLACAAGLVCLAWACGGDDTSTPADAGPDVTGGDAPGPEAGADASDAGADASTPACDTTAAFGVAAPVTELDGPADEVGARLSSDGLTVYFSSDRAFDGGILGPPFTSSILRLYRATRSAVGQPFGAPVPADDLDSDAGEGFASLSTDGLTVYLASLRGDPNHAHLYVATRAAPADPFGTPTSVASLELAGTSDDQPYLTADQSAVYFASGRTLDAGFAGFHVYRSAIDDAGVAAAPERVAAAYDPDAGPDVSFAPVVTADDLTLYFAAPAKGGGGGGHDIWRATRATRSDPFAAAAPVTELSTTDVEMPSYITPDGCTLYFYSNRSGGSGGWDIYRASKPAK